MLWYEYFSDPKRFNPSFDITFTTETKKELLLTLNKVSFIANKFNFLLFYNKCFEYILLLLG